MNKLLLLDKDGTLITPTSGKQFVESPQDQVVLPGVSEAILAYVEQGYTAIIVSNQGGVESGYKSLEDTVAEMQYSLKLLPDIDVAYFCPDFAGTKLWYVSLVAAFQVKIAIHKFNFRKPGSGMLIHAMHALGSSPFDCIMVGDRKEDYEAAMNAQVKFISAEKWRKQKLTLG